mgnify:CR=1 FL=1
MSQAECPISKLAAIIGQKWMLEIIYHLRERSRFCELQEAVYDLNPATLSKRLKALEEAGLVDRHEISSIPPHVEYELTEKGNDLMPILNAMADWVRRWHPGTAD